MRLVDATGDVFLHSHMYKGPAETENVYSCGQQRITVEAFARDEGAFPVETVVHVSRSGG